MKELALIKSVAEQHYMRVIIDGDNIIVQDPTDGESINVKSMVQLMAWLGY